MKHVLPLCLALLLTSCGESSKWVQRHEPTTDAERAAVATHVERVLSATPHSLAGSDQDWDDAIAAAHREARQSLCRLTYWEFKREDIFDPYAYTGKWRYADAPPQ